VLDRTPALRFSSTGFKEEETMAKVIPRSAGADRIFEDFETTLANGALSEQAEVRAAVTARLGPLAPGVAAAKADVAAHTLAAETQEDVLLAYDGGSDVAIGSAFDQIWNALGRPASSVDFTLIVGQGKSQWTDGDPREQGILMTILVSRIRTTTAAALQNGKDAWAQAIEDRAAVQTKLANSLKAAEAQLTVSKGIARGVADLAQVALARLKRDLTNLGLSDAQIHRIIPAYVAKPRAEEPKGGGGGGTGGSGGTGPTGPTGGTGPTGTGPTGPTGTGGTGPTGPTGGTGPTG
jgi:hypothetical protein